MRLVKELITECTVKIKRKEKLTGNTKVNESTGRGPDLQDKDNPLIILSKRPMDGLSLASPSPVAGIRSSKISTSSVTITRKAVAMSMAQLQSGGAVQRESFTKLS